MGNELQRPRLALSEAAHLLQVSERTIRRWLDSLDMPHEHDAGEPTFDRTELIEWADRHSFRLAADVPGEPDGPLPALAPAVERGGVHYHGNGSDGNGSDVDSALSHVARTLQLPELVDRDFLHQVLLAREDLGSTGIGDGIAIPHVRAPLVLHVEQPIVGVFLLDEPIDWNAIDRKPVRTLFVTISPGVRAHLHLLSRIGFVLRDASLREMLAERTDADSILQALRELERPLDAE